MSSSLRPRFRVSILLASLLAFSLACTGCGPDYPEQGISLVWESDIPGDRQPNLYPKDTGEADVLPHGVSGLLPMIFFDSSGQKSGELDLSLIPKHNSRQSLETGSPTEFGWVAVDRNVAYDRQFTPSGSRGSVVYLDTVIEMVNRDGEMVWQAPGPATAFLFQVDDSIIGCYGKDPSLLQGIPGQTLSAEYAAEAARRYDSVPNRVQLLDTATGSIQAQFDLPEAGYSAPIAVVKDERLYDGNMVLSTQQQEAGSSPVSGFLLTSALDGGTIASVDLQKVLPDTSVDSLQYTPAGLIAIGKDGTVSVMDLEGRVAWTATPKGVGEPGLKHPELQGISLVRASAKGLVMVRCEEGRSYMVSENVSTPLMSVTVFDRGGNIILYQRDLKNMFASSQAAERVYATAESSRTGEDLLYIFDMGKGTVTTSRARIPSAVTYAVSTSGEYVLILQNTTDGRMRVGMYRLEGLD